MLPDEQQTLMDDYVEAVDVYIVIKFNKFILEEGGGYIFVDGSWYPVRSGMGIFDALDCWC